MADIFSQDDAIRLLKNKYVIFLGDSNSRSLYKDAVWLLNSNTLIEDDVLRRKLEYSFLGDELLKRSDLNQGRDFEEIRRYCDGSTTIEYHFLTRCYNEKVEKLFRSFRKSDIYSPDLVYFSSCIWDISRWGPDGVERYKENVEKLMKLVKECFPPKTLFIWGTGLPVSTKIQSRGFLIKQVEFLKHTLRFEVMEANLFVQRLVNSSGYDVLDMHYYMRMQIHRRAKDGIHFTGVPVRYMTNLILTHVALAWGQKLPGHLVGGKLLQRVLSVPCTGTGRMDVESKALAERGLSGFKKATIESGTRSVLTDRCGNAMVTFGNATEECEKGGRKRQVVDAPCPERRITRVVRRRIGRRHQDNNTNY